MRRLVPREAMVVAAPLALAGAILSVLLGGCSGRCAPTLPSPGGGPATRTLSGVVNTDAFVVGPEERVACVGDVTVNCRTAQIRGALFSRPVTGPGRAGSSIAIKAQQDVLMAGSITAANGTEGAATGDGGQGGKGGEIVLRSAEGNLTVGVETSATAARPAQAFPTFLQSGNGGNGGNGRLGGAGGEGGSIVLEAPNGTLTIHECSGLFRVGNGGHGGNGVVEGTAVGSSALPGQLPNAGGNCGQLRGIVGDLAGVEIHDTGATLEGKRLKTVALAGETLEGGAGGSAGSFRFGEEPGSSPVTGGRAILPTRVRPAGDGILKGANGGDGGYQGGDGGAVYYWARNGGPGADGEGEVAWGGNGGRADSLLIGRWEGIAELYAGIFRDRPLRGGNGGEVLVKGGDGGDAAASGQPGGNGGAAVAQGGEGGDVRSASLAPELLKPGAGGDASALGGHGGEGGANCAAPSGPGGKGGKGGSAQATGGAGGSREPGRKDGAGGKATALGGSGGNGGDGNPPGAAGAGGWVHALGGAGTPEGSKTETFGKAGAAGKTCTAPPPVRTYGLVTSQSGHNYLSIFKQAFTVTLGPSQALSYPLGGSTNPLYAFTGQSLALAANGRDLWVARLNQDLRLYRNFITGGDRPPDVSLTATGSPGAFCAGSVWVDRTRDILYCTYKPALTGPFSQQILAWHNASGIVANRRPDRTLTLTDGGEAMALTGDSAADRLFVTRFGATGFREVAVLDNASVRRGAAPPDRRLQGAVRGDSGLAYDPTRDLLYGQVWDFSGNHAVALTGNASTANGTVTPRLLQGAATGLTGSPVALQVFPDADLLFVCCSEGDVLLFRNASALSGNVAPSGRQPFGYGGLVAMLAWQSG